MCIFKVVTFFSPSSWLSNPLNFLVAVRTYKIQVFNEAIFLLTIRIPVINKLFSVVTDCEELSPKNMHDISTERSCRITGQIQYISLSSEDLSTLC